jgi:glycosyltransferase involved in cell wall biosynthesis
VHLVKVIAIVPVFNEEKTLHDVLARVRKQVDFLICVNDGSADSSLRILLKFSREFKKTFIVDLPLNVGMAGALKQGFLFALYLERRKMITANDVVVTIDADGQHKPEYIRKLVKYLERKRVDVVLTRRNFAVYPLYKVLGNKFLTWTNSALAGFKYRDVESGLRLLRVSVLGKILAYYTGVKYSCAQEIALICAREGLRIDNDYSVDIAYYRAGTTIWDGFIVLALSFYTYIRLVFKIKEGRNDDLTLMKTSFERSKKDRRD